MKKSFCVGWDAEAHETTEELKIVGDEGFQVGFSLCPKCYADYARDKGIEIPGLPEPIVIKLAKNLCVGWHRLSHHCEEELIYRVPEGSPYGLPLCPECRALYNAEHTELYIIDDRGYTFPHDRYSLLESFLVRCHGIYSPSVVLTEGMAKPKGGITKPKQ